MLEWLNNICSDLEGVSEARLEDQVLQARRRAEYVQQKQLRQQQNMSKQVEAEEQHAI